MILPVTILFFLISYLCYKTKDDITLVDKNSEVSECNQINDDDLYKDLEDLFI